MLTLPAWKAVCAGQAPTAADYPPLRTGLRGSHPGSYKTAHDLAIEGRSFDSPAESDEQYDLVVVGAGISGLAAAHYYQRRYGGNAKILLLENHDDFGGHARRNEFHQGGQMRLGIGGAQYLAHWRFSEVVDELMRTLGVDIEELLSATEFGFGLNGREGPAIWFDKETYGVDRLVKGCDIGGIACKDIAASIDAFPIGAEARTRLKSFYDKRINLVEGLSREDTKRFLNSTPYTDFLKNHGDLNEEAIELFQSSSHGFWGTDVRTLSITEALASDCPGYHLLGYGYTSPPYHAREGFFPDGTASIARLLVKRLIPRVAANAHAGNIATAQFDYSELDREDSEVRLRLNATAVNVRQQKKEVVVTYAVNQKLRSVKARHSVLACNHSMIPYLCPDLPETQKEAMRYQVKVPSLVTNVLLESDIAIQRLGINGAYCPGRLHAHMTALKGINTGGYTSRMSDHGSVVLSFTGTITVQSKNGDIREGFRKSRKKILDLKFEHYEKEVRTVLGDMLGPAGFDRERDILAITVNRWPHGFAYEYRDLFDPEFPPGKEPHHIARLPWGKITIANADAGASAYLDSAVDQAYRAVEELPSS